MLKFEKAIDARCRAPSRPEVAMLDHHYIVIGTQYGYLRTAAGDVRTWKTYSGARKAVKRYVPL